MSASRRTLQLAVPVAALVALLTGASLASAHAESPTAPPASSPPATTAPSAIATPAKPTPTTKPSPTTKPTPTIKPTAPRTTRPADPNIALSITRLPKSPTDTVGVTITGMTPGSTITGAMSPADNPDNHTALQTFRANSKGVAVAAFNPIPGGFRVGTTYVVGMHVPMWLEDFPGLTFTYRGSSPETSTPPAPGNSRVRVVITRLPKSRYDTVGIRVTGLRPGQKVTANTTVWLAGTDVIGAARTLVADRNGVATANLPAPMGGFHRQPDPHGVHVWTSTKTGADELAQVAFTYLGANPKPGTGSKPGSDSGNTGGNRNQPGHSLPSTGN